MAIAPISIYDVSAQQAWLEDQAARGCFLQGYYAGIFPLASFEKGEPKAVRYRLEPVTAKEELPDFERREVYRSLGWEYVTTAGKAMHVWRCDDPAAPELHTEPETEGRAYDRLLRQQRWLAMFTVLICLFPWAVVLALSLGKPDYFSRQVESRQPAWALTVVWGAYGLFLWRYVQEYLSLRRFVRTLRAGLPPERRRPYRTSQFVSVLAAVVYIAVLLVQLANLSQPRSRSFQPLETYADPVPYVAHTEMENVKALPVDNWRTSVQWWTIESQGDLFCECRYYRLRLPWQAPELVESLLARIEDRGWDMEPLEVPGLDEAWAGNTGDGNSFLLLRLGTQVWSVSCRGGGGLDSWIGDYAAVLAAWK